MVFNHNEVAASSLHEATRGGSAETNALGVDSISQAGELPAGEVPTRPVSPAATEVVPEEDDTPPFESTPHPGVIAHDYAYVPKFVRPATYIFPIVASYIWFQYCRAQVIKQKPRMYINALASAFSGCELAHLMFFNWIQMKDISWKDARDSFGQALIWIYEKDRPVQIDYGAKRPSLKSPLVRKWWSRFSGCEKIQETRLTSSPRATRQFEKLEYEFYGPFGKAIHFYFAEEEKPALWGLHSYLLGKGPKPGLSDKMEAVFRPVLNCWDGSVGGRGKPYERPRAKDDPVPRAGTEPEHVDLDPELISVEFAKVLPFAMVRKELAKKEARELRALLEAKEKEVEKEETKEVEERKKRKKRGNKWTHKKSRKATVTMDEKPENIEHVRIIVIDGEPDKRVTRSMIKGGGASQRPFEPDVGPQKVSAKKTKRGKVVQELLKEMGYLPKDDGKVNDKAIDPPTDGENVDTSEEVKPLPSKEDAAEERDDTAEEEELAPRKNKGKGKAVDTEMCEEVPIVSKKRKRNDDDVGAEYLEYECIEPALSEPGPSSRPMRYVRRRVRRVPDARTTSTCHCYHPRDPSTAEAPRGLKRKRDEEEETGPDDSSKRRRLEEPELSPEERMRRFAESIEAILSRPPERPRQSDGDEVVAEMERMLEEDDRRNTERRRPDWSSEESDADMEDEECELDLFNVDNDYESEDLTEAELEALATDTPSEDDIPGSNEGEALTIEDLAPHEAPHTPPFIPQDPHPESPSAQLPPTPQPIQLPPPQAANPPGNIPPEPHLPHTPPPDPHPQQNPLRRHETTIFMGSIWTPHDIRPLRSWEA